mmetsp:Transcript_417/g.829  ORF Transcript_417/g.829 Transcript_417/m.829 type:complete len:178 (+) Transcript_417:1155-1688(+)
MGWNAISNSGPIGMNLMWLPAINASPSSSWISISRYPIVRPTFCNLVSTRMRSPAPTSIGRRARPSSWILTPGRQVLSHDTTPVYVLISSNIATAASSRSLPPWQHQAGISVVTTLLFCPKDSKRVVPPCSSGKSPNRDPNMPERDRSENFQKVNATRRAASSPLQTAMISAGSRSN